MPKAACVQVLPDRYQSPVTLGLEAHTRYAGPNCQLHALINQHSRFFVKQCLSLAGDIENQPPFHA